ncbi:hypothetical protein GCM10012279_37690 [Micromonospora yangpuensis]|nr:hypothetical protein GCM10012279_37690 [Micromonospora yangpuensis]
MIFGSGTVILVCAWGGPGGGVPVIGRARRALRHLLSISAPALLARGVLDVAPMISGPTRPHLAHFGRIRPVPTPPGAPLRKEGPLLNRMR